MVNIEQSGPFKIHKKSLNKLQTRWSHWRNGILFSSNALDKFISVRGEYECNLCKISLIDLLGVQKHSHGWI